MTALGHGIGLFQQGAFSQALVEMRLASERGVTSALNRLWLEVVESDAVGLSREVLDAASVVEAEAKIECLESLNGTSSYGRAVETMTVTFGRGDYAWATAKTSEDGFWIVESSRGGGEVRDEEEAIAHMDLGRELCDFRGDKYVDLVKRGVVGYDATRPWDLDYERVSEGGAAKWNDFDKRDVLSFAHVGSLNALEAAVKSTLQVEGDVAECGAFRGGTLLVAAATLEAYESEKLVWAYDTFQGVPDNLEYAWPEGAYSADEETVQTNFEKYGLRDRLRTVPGAFNRSKEEGPTKLSVLRVDADTYSGTLEALHMLYDRVQVNGVVIVDDYHLTGCRKAVKDFRTAKNISTPLLPIPIDYVLGCPLRDNWRCPQLALDILDQANGEEAAKKKTPRISRNPMRLAQNVYWRRTSLNT